MEKIRKHGNDEAVRGLIRQLAQTEAALQQALGDDVDVVVDPDSGTPLLLPPAQARLVRELEEQVDERTAELQQAYEALQAVNEELQVAGEEFQRQNTDLVIARNELEAERQRYRDLFDFAPDGYLVTDPLGTVREANLATALLLGVEARFLSGEPLAAFASGDDARTLSDHLARLRDQQDTEPLRWQMVLQPRDRKPFVAALTAAPVRDDEGRLLSLRWLVRDVSDRVHMEEALRANEERYRLVADFTHDWEYWIGPDGEYRYISPSCQRITGYSPGEFQRDLDLMQRIIHPDDLPIWEAHARAERDQAEVRTIDFRIHTRDGRECWISHACQPVYGQDSAWLGWRGSNRDVTEHKRAEHELRDSERRYRQLFESMTEGFALHEIVCDDQGRPVDYRFLEVNPGFEQLTGLDRDDLLGKTVLQVLPDTEPFWIETFGHVALSGEPAQFEQYSGALSRHYAVLAYRPAENQFACVFQDVTERIEAERVLRENAQKLRALFELLPVGLSILDAERTLHYQNPALIRILDLAPEAVRRESRQQQRVYLRPDGSPMPLAEMPSARAAAEGRIVRDVEIGVVKEDGTQTWVNVTAAPLPFDDWNVIVVTTDITEQVLARRRIEELAAEAQHHADELDAVFDAMADAVIVYDGEGELVQANRAAIAGYGFDPVGMDRQDLGERIAARYPDGRPVPVDEFLHVRALQGETVRERPYLMTGVQGQDLHVLTSAAPLYHGSQIVGAVIAWRDVTAQVEAERTRDRLIAILEETPDMISMASPEGRVLYFNRAVRQIMDISEDADVADLVIADAHPDWAARLVQEEGIPTAIRGGVWQGRSAVRTFQGEEIPVSQVILAHRGDDGQVEHLSTIARDVRREQTILAQLETEQARLRAIFDSAPEGIVVADAGARILLTNPAAARLYAHPVPYGQEYDSHVQLQLCHPDGPPFDPRDLPLTRSALDGEVVREEEIDIIWPDGRRRNLLINTAPIRTGEGRIAGAVGVFQDITERRDLAQALRRAHDELERRVEERTAELVRLTENLRSEISVRVHTEQELRASEERFRQMAETIDEVFMLIDPASQRFLYLSPRYETVWGRPRRAAYEQGSAFLEGVLPKDRERLLAAWRQQSKSYDEEFRIERPDGQLRWIRLRVFAILDEEGAVRRLAGVAQDITREKRAQAALIQAERLSMAGQLAASLAHEINNPIQSALGCLDLAIETLEEGDDPRSYLEVTTEAIARAARVVSQLRSLHRESPDERPELTDVRALLERVLLLTRKRCETSGVEVELQAADPLPRLPLKVDGMQQVFLNLVLNAVEAMPDGGRLKIQAVATDGPPGVAVHFADDGGGMAVDVLEHLFEPFFTTKEEGLGLGLFVSQNMVRQHGGHIDAESRLGEGTTLTVWLPATEEENAPSR